MLSTVRTATSVVVIAIVLPMCVLSQELVGWGIRAGVTSANQTQKNGDLTVSMQYRTGLSLGTHVEWIDHPFLSVHTELSYNQKGHRLDIPITTAEFPDGTGEFTKESVRFDYLCVSILAKVKFAIGSAQPYVLFGPRVDISLANSVNIEGREPIRTYYLAGWTSHLRHYKDAQIGGDVALGCIGDVGLPMRVGAEVRYSPDFTPSAEFPNASTRNETWELSLLIAI